MGILNSTPDSFFDGTERTGAEMKAPMFVERALKMEEEGADWIDIGGESTRPGARPVEAAEEIKRVIPVIEGIRKKSSIPVSIDTTKAVVAKQGLEAGANMINDVRGLCLDGEMIDAALQHQAPVVMMHSRGTPGTMQQLAHYGDVVKEVGCELQEAIDKALQLGLSKQQILIDPGFGFAKNFEQNLTLLKNLRHLKEMGYPLVVGVSRKSFIGKLLNQDDPADRLYGSLACAAYAVMQGADILRVHDVAETKQIVEALQIIDSC